MQTSPHHWHHLAEQAARGAYSAVLFDCDGTLVDSEPLCERAWRSVADDLGLPRTPDVSPAGSSFEQRIGALRRHHPGLPPSADLYRAYWSRLSRLYRAELRPIVPVYDTAVRLRRSGVPVAVVSNSEQLRLEFTILCAAPRLSAEPLVGWSQGRRPKPAPDLYLLAADLLEVAPSRCLAVEDSPIGAEAALAAGMTATLVR
ncbi:HAD family hydrolase [Microbacterium sp. LWO12-1.2]|uniref:HAD family hydrolase n=1 Tax=Microbacterium sp. LWO12-1.2 TaxID=3135261 RepID=UPI00344A1FB2